MKPIKYFFIILLTIVFVFGLFVAFIAIAVSSLSSIEPDIEKNSILEIHLTGEIQEYSNKSMLSKLINLSDDVLTLSSLSSNLSKAKYDSRITGVYLKIDSIKAGWSKVQEIRSCLDDFKKSGKFIIGYMISGGEKEYSLLCSCDLMYCPPESMIMLDGIVIQKYYVKSLLEKLMIEPILIRHGRFKSYGETFIRDNMSDFDREQLTSILDDTYKEFLSIVSERRKVTIDKLSSLIENGILTSEELKEHDLVDDMLYDNSVISKLMEKNKEHKKLTVVKLSKYEDANDVINYDQNAGKIAIIYASGGIVSEDSASYKTSVFRGDVITAKELTKHLRKSVEDDEIKAIILRIDSPGGDGVASDMIWGEIMEAKKKKPVIASMSDVAASGGYYIASPCNKIVSLSTTITGSIGVFGMLLNAQELYKYLGISHDQIKKGAYADIGTTTRKPTEQEVRRITTLLDKFYSNFIEKVAKNRNMQANTVDSIAEGRVWSGLKAKEIGLVDEIGGLQKAISVAKQEAGLKDTAFIETVNYPKELSIIDELIGGETSAKSIIDITSFIPSYFVKYFSYLNSIFSNQEVKIYTALPYFIEIK